MLDAIFILLAIGCFIALWGMVRGFERL